jgi:hypothetical protein
MEIPLGAQVNCINGMCGHSVCVLIDPVLDEVTHVVIMLETESPSVEYIVPVKLISSTVEGVIQLNCSKAELEKMAPFVQTEFIEEKIPAATMGYGGGSMYGMGSFYVPYVTPEVTVKVPVEHLQIPPGELAVRRGNRVEATDGYVGKVDEFVIDPLSGHVTYLVMREGHLWGEKNVMIPLSALGDTRKDTVFLKIDKHEIESLPTFPVQRRWS